MVILFLLFYVSLLFSFCFIINLKKDRCDNVKTNGIDFDTNNYLVCTYYVISLLKVAKFFKVANQYIYRLIIKIIEC